ncbi:3-hydroxyacyl-CoA dehydrogenase NAD-binding domain-containing protein [Microvirga brassicacearum]|uniref:3-hydroxyacyl-CoA dehydrogenase NAD-binding domain-containing protein n=1 Tax=Microvirga brassicacearum TaxID=2580413 RepID=UPI0023B9E256|nr:3-hydroxyacyl-CoA dehydrogenase NAD-binding domain-containing protein [Microvirga brassicacearum]
MESIRTIAIIGCGTVGASWAALFLAGGYDVIATDPGPDAERKLKAFIERAAPQASTGGPRTCEERHPQLRGHAGGSGREGGFRSGERSRK